ncbi:MAG: gliding motility-associated C-terminal domain-containing protein, partial [Bacteroidota bacterium]|nr:gliding motility-associated C-terminal domain-containing protein [Bacteroidota bacterium]
PIDKIVDCKKDRKKEFETWLSLHGGAQATDNCGALTWTAFFESADSLACDTTVVEFVVTDACDNSSLTLARFISIDTSAPVLLNNARSITVICGQGNRDTLKNWLNNFGYAQAEDVCKSKIRWKHNFNGDSSASLIKVKFTVTDICGNMNVTTADFIQQDAPDTFYQKKYFCDTKLNRKDTTLFVLPGCDSVVILESVGVQVDTFFIEKNVCQPGIPEYNYLNIKTAFSCDSIVSIRNIYIKPDTQYITQTLCGIIDTQVNIFTYPTQLCDSVIIETLLPARTDKIYNTNFSCDPADIGLDSIVWTNKLGCDSIIYTNTILSSVKRTFRDSFICGLSSPYQDSVIFQRSPCDSVAVIQYIPLKRDSIYTSQMSCDISDKGFQLFYFKNGQGCDSVVVLETIIFPSDTISMRKNTCIYSESGIDTTLFTNRFGCDSFLILENIFVPADTLFFVKQSCDVTKVGMDTTYHSTQNCDSVVIIQTEFIPSKRTFLQEETCFQDSAKLDSVILLSYESCDSMVVTEFIWKPVSLEFETKAISCFGYSDGTLSLKNLVNIQAPYELYLNQLKINDINDLQSLKSGDYTFYIKDSKSCISEEYRFTIQEPAELTVDVGPDQTLLENQTIRLDAKSIGDIRFWSWQPSEFFSCPTCQSSNGRFDKNETVWIEVTDQAGCRSLDTLLIFVKKFGRVYAPNVISNNGDQVNDHFYLSGDENNLIEYLQIFDRWGEEVFNAENIQPNRQELGWDGTHRGEKLAPGVYVYLAQIKRVDG